MSLQSVYQELRTLPVPASVEEEEQRSLPLFHRMMQIVSDPDLITHPELRALTTLITEHIQHQIIPVTAPPFALPSLSFIVWQQKSRLYPMIAVPEHYLTQVREDPLFQLGGIIDISSRVRDYLCGKLEVPQTALRASAFEAELLLHLRPKHEQEGLAFSLGGRECQVLDQFPLGLRSLPEALVYPTPALWMVNYLPESDGNGSSSC